MPTTNVAPRHADAPAHNAPERDYAAEYARRQEIARRAGFASYWQLREALRAGDPRACDALRRHPARKRAA